MRQSTLNIGQYLPSIHVEEATLRFSTFVFGVIACACLVSLIGCGGNPHGPLGAIEGEVTLKGEVVPVGTKVLFMGPESGHAGFAFTDERGKYRIEWRKSGRTFDGLPVGKYQVMIVPASGGSSEEVSAEDIMASTVNKPVRSPKSNPPKTSIPAKYLRASTSGIEHSIVEGRNEIKIELDK